MLAEKLSSADIKEIRDTIVNAAKAGDMVAAKLLWDRLVPVPKGRRLRFPMPPINTADDIVKAFDGLWAAVSNGEITAEEATILGALLERHGAVLKDSAIEKRLKRIEEIHGKSERA